MAKFVDRLLRLPLFRRVSAEELRAVQPLLKPVKVPSGKRLWSKGDVGDRLGILVSGTLRARVEGKHLNSVRTGEVFGEAGAFFREGRRTADLVSDGECRVVMFTRAGLGEMRWDHGAVYDALLRECGRLMSERIRVTTLALAKMAPGDVARPTRGQEPGALAKMWRSIKPGRPTSRCPRLVPLLRKLPTMAQVPEATLRRLAATFEQRAVEHGEVLCLEGEIVDAAWIIASGGVDILRNVGGARAEYLATIQPGGLFGHNGLHNPNATRTASCVASKAGWLYQMDPMASRAMKGEVWRVWNEALLYSYIEQIRCSNHALGGLIIGTREEARPKPATSDELASILSASGALAGGRLSDELDEVSFVVDEAARRDSYKR